MMQDHPIDLVRAQLAEAALRLGRGTMGLLSGLALIGLLWLTSLKPADAAGPIPTPDFVASARAQGHLGVAPLRLDGSVLAQTGVLTTSLSVCRLVLDAAADAPQPVTCAAPLAPLPGGELVP